MDLILMASGDSRRFGRNKLMELIGGKPIFEYSLETFSKVKQIKNRIIVSRYKEILNKMERYGFIPVQNNHSERGISESICLGVQKVEELHRGVKKDGKWDCKPRKAERLHSELQDSVKNSNNNKDCNCIKKYDAGIIFAVCDQPLLTSETVEKMIEEFIRLKQENESLFPILCAKGRERRGNPVIFDRVYARELANLRGDIGGKQVIKMHEDALRFFHVVEEKELMDIDTMGDLQEITVSMKQGDAIT